MGICAKMARSARDKFARDGAKLRAAGSSRRLLGRDMDEFKEFYLTVCRRRDFPNVQWPEFLRPVLEAMLFGKDKRVLSSTPPRHLKSSAIIAMLLYIALTERGTKQAYGSYDGDIVRTMSLEFDAYYRAWTGQDLSENLSEKRIWSNIVYFVSVRSAFTGRVGANRNLVIDDPFKNLSDAWSLTIRDQVWTNISSAAFTRLETGGNFICNGTRWHSDDVHGRFLQDTKTEWVVINCPAINEAGEALFPELRPLDWLIGIRHTLGGPQSWVWLALYQGTPPNEAFGYFPIANLKRHKDLPPGYTITRTVDGIDLSYTKATYSDKSAHLIGSLTGCGKIIVRLGWMDNLATPDFFARVKNENALMGSSETHWLACKAEVDRCVDFDQLYDVHVQGHESQGKKVSALDAQAAWAAGEIYLPDDWDAFPSSPLHQIISFNADEARHDDLADCLFAVVSALKDKFGGESVRLDGEEEPRMLGRLT